MEQRKAISALLGTVLTVMITIAIGTILFQSFKSTTEDAGMSATEQSKTVIDCSLADIRIDSVVINTTANSATITVSNIGNEDITIVSGTIFAVDGQACTVWNETVLAKGDVDARTATCTFASCSAISHAQVTTDCNGVSASLSDGIVCET